MRRIKRTNSSEMKLCSSGITATFFRFISKKEHRVFKPRDYKDGPKARGLVDRSGKKREGRRSKLPRSRLVVAGKQPRCSSRAPTFSRARLSFGLADRSPPRAFR